MSQTIWEIGPVVACTAFTVCNRCIQMRECVQFMSLSASEPLTLCRVCLSDACVHALVNWNKKQ